MHSGCGLVVATMAPPGPPALDALTEARWLPRGMWQPAAGGRCDYSAGGSGISGTSGISPGKTIP